LISRNPHLMRRCAPDIPTCRKRLETQTFEREPGRTADPSAALGMTKGRVALPCTAARQTLGGAFVSAYIATTIYGRVALPFVIPSAGICGAPRLPLKGLGFVSSQTRVGVCG
jgi:hypothetical protein